MTRGSQQRRYLRYERELSRTSRTLGSLEIVCFVSACGEDPPNPNVRRLSCSEENIAIESSPPNVATTILGRR